MGQSQRVQVSRVVRNVLRWALVLGGTTILYFAVSEVLKAEKTSDTVILALLGLGALLIVFGSSGARIDSFEAPGGWKASLTTSGGATRRAAQTIAVADAFAQDPSLSPVVRAEALQVVAGVNRARAYERAVGRVLKRLHPGLVEQAQPFDQADFEVRNGANNRVLIEVLWLDRRWSSRGRFIFFGSTEQKDWEERYLGHDVGLVVTNIAPPAPAGNSSTTYVKLTGAHDAKGEQLLKKALEEATWV